MKSLAVFLMTASLCTCVARTAHAQTPGAIGVRAGVSGDPGQFYAGIHYESSPLVDHLRFRPNLEVGVGGDQTLVTLNFEFAYSMPLDTGRRRGRNDWSLYVGAGPALVIDRFTNNTDTGGGFNILIGAQHREGFFTELKVGLASSPGVKFGVGYTFR